jgi:hypothetical protein
MSTYDPGDLYEGRPPRRRREYRRDSGSDDAWAAADQDQGPGADIGDLAAGYLWEDDERYGVKGQNVQRPTDLGPLPTPAYQGRARRSQRPRGSASPAAWLGDRGAYPGRSRRGLSPAGGPAPHVPYWQVLLVVILGMLALLVAALACASVLALL